MTIMKLKLIPLLIAGSALLTACQQNANTMTTPSIQKEDAVASVNGQYISKFSLDALTTEVKKQSRGQVIPEDQLIDELVKRELLVQQAKSKHLGQTPEIQNRLVMMQNSLLSQLAIEDYIKANPVTDAELQAAYDKQISSTAALTEFKARHILVKTEDEAKAIIAKLDKGGDFAELAKTESTGPSKTKGGDLGWFSAKQMVEPFSKAVEQLENGKYTEAPVSTRFGWHVILREDSREQTPPPFDTVKAQLEPMVQREKLTAYLDSLTQGAQIEIFAPVVEEVEVVEVVEVVEQPAKVEVDSVTIEAQPTEATPATPAK